MYPYSAFFHLIFVGIPSSMILFVKHKGGGVYLKSVKCIKSYLLMVPMS